MAKAIKKASKITKATKTVKAVKKVASPAVKVTAAIKATKGFANPYRIGGGYWASIEALRALGMNKSHDFQSIIGAVKLAMGKEAWKAFTAKDARNVETGKDGEARAMQNVSVVARKDYGKPIIEQGYEVRFSGKEKTAGLFKVGK